MRKSVDSSVELHPVLKEREEAPRERLPLSELVVAGNIATS